MPFCETMKPSGQLLSDELDEICGEPLTASRTALRLSGVSFRMTTRAAGDLLDWSLDRQLIRWDPSLCWSRRRRRGRRGRSG